MVCVYGRLGIRYYKTSKQPFLGDGRISKLGETFSRNCVVYFCCNHEKCCLVTLTEEMVSVFFWSDSQLVANVSCWSWGSSLRTGSLWGPWVHGSWRPPRQVFFSQPAPLKGRRSTGSVYRRCSMKPWTFHIFLRRHRWAGFFHREIEYMIPLDPNTIKNEGFRT